MQWFVIIYKQTKVCYTNNLLLFYEKTYIHIFAFMLNKFGFWARKQA